MKKSLIALAVLGVTGLGFSGAAMAQSSVTLYGVADAGIARVQTKTVDPVTGAVTKTSSTGMSSAGTMNNGTSRLGVRGVEDLGGGLKAGFNFESGLSLNDGTSNYSGGNFWSRAANVWIGGNWGTFKMGRTLNPTFYAVAAWELTGTANYSVVASTYGFSSLNGPRNSSQFSYKTPDIGGLSAELGYVFKDNLEFIDVNTGEGANKWDLNVVYANGPISAGLGVNKIKSTKTNYTIGGKYSFGQFAVAASYNTLNAVSGTERRGVSLGGSYNTGPFTVTLDLTRDTTAKFGGVDAKKYTNGLLEGKYALSKRTFVYAAFLRLDSTNNYGIGLRHNF